MRRIHTRFEIFSIHLKLECLKYSNPDSNSTQKHAVPYMQLDWPWIAEWAYAASENPFQTCNLYAMCWDSKLEFA